MIWVGPPGREIATPPATPEIAEAIRRFARQENPVPETFYVEEGGGMVLRTIYPSVAREQSCITCHNALKPVDPPRRINDVIGAFVASVRADTYFDRALLQALAIGLFIFLGTSGTGGVFFWKQHGHLQRRARTEQALRQAKLEAEAANVSKSQFLATMSHALRTPLNSILGFSELIIERAKGADERAQYGEYATDIHSSGKHLLTIINDILDMSKIEANQLVIREDTVSLGLLLAACCRSTLPLADDAGVCLECEVDEGLPALRCDELRLRQVVLNFLSNAIKFTPRGGRVTLGAVGDTEKGIEIWLEDTGIGMAPEEIAIALKAFQQVENTLQRAHEDTGLGLPLSKRLVEMHGGRLSVVSEPGRGTRVSVHLPSERAVPRPSQRVSAA